MIVDTENGASVTVSRSVAMPAVRIRQPRGRERRQALCMVCFVGLGGVGSAVAQETANAPKRPDSTSTIVVTASRITTSGFEAPTPVTVVGQPDIENRGATNIAAVLNELPAFYASTTPNTTTLQGTTNGYNVVELRVLGANRTLFLLDGRRHVPTGLGETTNLNVIPSTAISRVEIVTGGLSATWGSDAVAGVVNVILDKQLQGFRTQVQYGASPHGDAGNMLASAAFGSDFADGRGHFTIAMEYNDDQGIASQTARDWGKEGWGIVGNPSGPPNRLIAPDVTLAGVTEGGLIRGPAPIANIQFGPGGTLLPYQPGSPISGSFQVGGDGADMGQYRDLTAALTRKNFFTQVDYSLTDSISAYVEASFAQFHSRTETVQPFDFGGVSIQPDNAFIPPDLQTILTANSIGAFGLFRIDTDFGFITADTDSRTYRTLFGLKGDLPRSWSWDAYYLYGQTQITNLDDNNRIEANYRFATDAVVDPMSGNIVCRATLSGQAPGCVPINLFGFGSPSAAAVNYITGTEFLRNTITQQVAAISAQGPLFDLPAGPVSSAIGVEYRDESVTAEADEVAISNGYLIGNFKPIDGAYNVKEAFAELNIPVLADKPGFDLLELNGAFRYTDYSTSGPVQTWKAGLNYKPFSDLRLRGTISRDIRAPNIGELYASQGLTFTNVNDPVTNTTVFTRVVTGGNTDLDPEEGDTETYGIVYQPRWASELQLSADWYDITINDAISALGAQTLVNNCQAGDSAACAAITRDASGTITQIDQRLLNIAQLHVSGIDFEGRYGTDVFQSGHLSIRAIANYVEHIQRRNSVSVPYTENVGGLNPDTGTVPHWRGTLGVTYDSGPLTVFAQARYVGPGEFNNTFTSNDLADNSVDAVTYFDTSVSYDFGHDRNEGVQVFLGVNNVLDKDPPILPINFIVPLATNPILYDVVGRYYYGGIRARF